MCGLCWRMKLLAGRACKQGLATPVCAVLPCCVPLDRAEGSGTLTPPGRVSAQQRISKRVVSGVWGVGGRRSMPVSIELDARFALLRLLVMQDRIHVCENHGQLVL